MKKQCYIEMAEEWESAFIASKLRKLLNSIHAQYCFLIINNINSLRNT